MSMLAASHIEVGEISMTARFAACRVLQAGRLALVEHRTPQSANESTGSGHRATAQLHVKIRLPKASVGTPCQISTV